MLEKTYLYKLWNTSKVLFAIVLFLLAGHLFFTYKGILNFPFFPYEMYAHPQKKPNTTQLTQVYVNDSLLNYTQLPNWTEGNIVNTIDYYERFQKGNNWAKKAWLKRFGAPDTKTERNIYNRLVPSDAQMEKYPEWLSNYIENATHSPVNTLFITKIEYQYANQQLVSTGKETVILDYRR